MAKYFWDLSAVFSDNTDIAGQSTAGSANANTLDTIIQKTLAVLAVFGDYLGGVGTVGGTADAITLTSSATYPIQSLANGVVLAFKAGSANTGAATINVDTLGVKAIRRQGDSALSANDIVANGVYLIRYDTAYNSSAGAWVLLNPTASTSLTAATTTKVLTGTDSADYATADAIAALWEKGSDIASASTITIAEGGFFHVTGTTTITDIDWATAKNGRGAWVVFDGALTLTHNATTLKLPGGANITTAANDRAFFIQDASDNVICLTYIKADGTPVVSSSGLTLDTEQATTSGTTKDFTIPAGAKRITVMLNGVSIDAAAKIGLQLGDSGGIEATGYSGRCNIQTDTGNDVSATSTTQFDLSSGTSASNAMTGHVVLARINSTPTWIVSAVLSNGGGTEFVFTLAGAKTLSAELTTVRLMGGTFDSGVVNVLYE